MATFLLPRSQFRQISREIAWLQTVRSVIYSLPAGLVVSWVWLQPLDNADVSVVQTIMLGAAMGVGYWMFAFASIFLTVKKRLEEAYGPYEGCEFGVEFLWDSMVSMVKDAKANLPYTNIKKVILSNKYLYLFINGGSVVMIPRASLGDQERNQLEELEIINPNR